MLRGLELGSSELAESVKLDAFERGVLLETCGPQDTVVKLMPALNIDTEALDEGLEILTNALERVLKRKPRASAGEA
jgi:diaminobutyrate-2-oxoglutarate transaminase